MVVGIGIEMVKSGIDAEVEMVVYVVVNSPMAVCVENIVSISVLTDSQKPVGAAEFTAHVVTVCRDTMLVLMRLTNSLV